MFKRAATAYSTINLILLFSSFLIVMLVHFICTFQGIGAMGVSDAFVLGGMYTMFWALGCLAATILTWNLAQGYVMAGFALFMYIPWCLFAPSGLYTQYASMEEMHDYYMNTVPAFNQVIPGDSKFTRWQSIENTVEDSWGEYDIFGPGDGKYTREKFEPAWNNAAHWFRKHSYPLETPPQGLVPKYQGDSEYIKNHTYKDAGPHRSDHFAPR